MRTAAYLLIATAFFGCVSSPRFVTGGGAASREPFSPRISAKPLLTVEGLASYYAEDFNGKKTANGETYDMYQFTAAHRSFPFGTKVRVTNLENHRTVIVRVNDRGPFKLERLIDVSLAAATQLGMTGTGTAKVKLEVLEWGSEASGTK